MSKSKSKNLRDHAAELTDKLAPHVESARDKAGPMLADARDKAGPVLADARQKAAPLVAEARDKAAPALAEAKDKLTHEVLPVITAALAAAGEATEEVRGEARRRSAATAAALKGEVEAPEKKKHRLRKLILVLGLGGLVAFVAKKLSDRQATTAWQSSFQPTPAATPPTSVDETPTATAAAAAAGRGSAQDEGGATPDVAAADAAAEPHPATTPDDPAEEVDVQDKRPDA